MSFIKRLGNLWKMSAQEPEKTVELGEIINPFIPVEKIKKPQKGKFLPYQKIDPVKQLINESSHE